MAHHLTPKATRLEAAHALLDEALDFGVDPDTDLHGPNCGITPDDPSGTYCNCGVDRTIQRLHDKLGELLEPTVIEAGAWIDYKS